MISVLVAVCLCIAFLALVVGLVPAFFLLEGDRPTRHPVVTSDGWTLAVWHRPAVVRRFEEPVVLCHGLGNNHTFMEFHETASLAAFLAARGFDCYSIDLRGAGPSTGPDLGPHDASFDDHLKHDLPAVLDFVRLHSGQARAHWVGHSMGGLLGLAGAGGATPASFVSLVTIGSPVYFRFNRPIDGLLTLVKRLSLSGRFPLRELAALGAPLAGRFPVPKLARTTANLDNIEPALQRALLAHTFAPLWRGVLSQVEDWVRHDVFRSVDGTVDYREGMKRLTLPVLVIGGTVDGLAPPEATQAYFDALTTGDKQLVLLGRAHGQVLDYGHGDLLVGRSVRTEVYPGIATWLEARATARAGSGVVSAVAGPAEASPSRSAGVAAVDAGPVAATGVA